MMSKLRKFSTLCLVAIAAGSMWWLGGCDFSPVDDGASVSVAQHIEKLARVTSQSEAEASINKFLAKIGATNVERPGMTKSKYFGFGLTDDAVKRLAAAQVRFNKGDESAGLPVSTVYEVLDRSTTIETVFQLQTEAVPVELVDVLTALQISANRAKENPEQAENALVLAIVADANGIPKEVPQFDIAKVISPVQGILLGMWLRQEGHNIPAFSFDEATSKGGPNGKGNDGKYKDNDKNGQSTCPAGQVLIAKYEWYGSYKFEKGENKNAVSITGNAKNANWTSTVPIVTVVVKGGQNRDYVTYASGAYSGTIKDDQIGNKGISHVLFCGGKTPPPPPPPNDYCYECCKMQYLIDALLCLCDPDFKACELRARERARECGNGCHDQGISAPSWWSF